MPEREKSAEASRAVQRCHLLLCERGELLVSRLAAEALDAFRSLDGPAVDVFFDLLVRELSPDPDAVRRWGRAYSKEPSHLNLTELQQATEAPRRELFRRLNVAPGGTSALIEMRSRLLRGIDAHPAWAAVDADLAHLLRSWFNGGFLELRRIDWRTPQAVLENLIKYEAVHKIRDWWDLRRRLQQDRRCYAFFHPALPDEPLIFTELALTSGMSTKVQPLLDPDAEVLDPSSCDSAMFYSISSCHDGLRGVSFGNALLRRVADQLGREFPRLQTFATISPVPGFRSWLTAQAGDTDAANPGIAALVTELQSSNWMEDGARSANLARVLMPLCAFYLLHTKRGKDPADPVARFHLGNGARLERLNWMSDISAAGLQRSVGLTANYLYKLSDVERNHQAYAADRTVTASRRLEKLAQSSRLVA